MVVSQVLFMNDKAAGADSQEKLKSLGSVGSEFESVCKQKEAESESSWEQDDEV